MGLNPALNITLEMQAFDAILFPLDFIFHSFLYWPHLDVCLVDIACSLFPLPIMKCVQRVKMQFCFGGSSVSLFLIIS